MMHPSAARDPVSASTSLSDRTIASATSAAPLPNYTLDQIARQLTHGYNQWSGGDWQAFELGASRRITVDLLDLSAGERFVARAALASWADLTGITFREISQRTGNGSPFWAQITFGNDQAGAWAYTNTTGNRIDSSYVNVASNWVEGPASLDSYLLQTYIHEIGHALGLGHAGNYNGDANWSTDAMYRQDSVLFSIMSYFFQDSGDPESNNPYYKGSWGTIATPMIADIIAIQNLYGVGEARAGSTVYGANSNVDGYLGDLFGAIFDGDAVPDRVWNGGNMLMTIYDSGGFDTLNLSTVREAQTINLTQNSFSSVGGYVNNLNIARGTVIEAAIGGFGADRINGNAANNRLMGQSGNDRLLGQNGDDTLTGGTGDDVMRGGAGIDSASWAGVGLRVTVDLTISTAQFTGLGRDLLSGIENLVGGNLADRLSGDSLGNRLEGGAGNDRLTGRYGADVLIGGIGADTLDGGVGSDLLLGSAGTDTFRFDAGADTIAGFQDDVDTIALSRSLWGGGARTINAILASAEDLGNAVALEFDNARLVIRGAERIADLRDDIVFY